MIGNNERLSVGKINKKLNRAVATEIKPVKHQKSKQRSYKCKEAEKIAQAIMFKKLTKVDKNNS